MIDVEEIRKLYGNRAALDGFNLHVMTGELLGLVGPNGAGKSTLIKLLATLLAPTSGTAKIANIDVCYDPDSVKKITGYMPDQPGLYQDMRLREFLQFFADAFHIPRSGQPQVIEKAMVHAGLLDRKEQFVEELSFGLKQRLFLAKTLLHQPKVLLLDEPATGLDPIARLDLREQLKVLHTSGVTILISSHILSDLEDICTRVVFISQGKNVTGTADALPDANNLSGRKYQIEILNASGDEARILEGAAGVKVIDSQACELTVTISGGKNEAAAVLRFLIGAGVEVVRFEPQTGALEQAYQRQFGGNRP
ncbi:MAG TPA: ABC transporter ATP-binding protein [Terriglobales bacterium]|jgi:ABC-2 type transport system ATP-binding protein|nr:ABC transporter ATP-binding protein [Terriglobales bacterium]